jgi:formylmethanofuran dehydrogenase subunit C
MKGGTIVLKGGAEIRTGAWMQRGTIIALKPVHLLPTFSYTSECNPIFLRLYAKVLQEYGLNLPVEPKEGSYLRYMGDTSVPGKGEILVWRPRGS